MSIETFRRLVVRDHVQVLDEAPPMYAVRACAARQARIGPLR